MLDIDLDLQQEQLREWQEMQKALEEDGSVPAKGSFSPKVTVTVFIDYQCPYCRETMQLVDSTLAESNDVRLLVRHLPSPAHDWSRAAAEIAACVYRQSEHAFWAVHAFLLAHQANLSVKTIEATTKSVLEERKEIRIPDFERCLEQPSNLVRRDLEFANTYGIQATPTLFVNGERMDGVQAGDDLRRVIQRHREQRASY